MKKVKYSTANNLDYDEIGDLVLINKKMHDNYHKASIEVLVSTLEDIQDIIDDITDASSSKPYTLFLLPGIHIATSGLDLKAYVHLVGLGGALGSVLERGNSGIGALLRFPSTGECFVQNLGLYPGGTRGLISQSTETAFTVGGMIGCRIYATILPNFITLRDADLFLIKRNIFQLSGAWSSNAAFIDINYYTYDGSIYFMGNHFDMSINEPGNDVITFFNCRQTTGRSMWQSNSIYYSNTASTTGHDLTIFRTGDTDCKSDFNNNIVRIEGKMDIVKCFLCYGNDYGEVHEANNFFEIEDANVIQHLDVASGYKVTSMCTKVLSLNSNTPTINGSGTKIRTCIEYQDANSSKTYFDGDVEFASDVAFNGNVSMYSLPSGSTQPGGLSAGDLWVDTNDQTVKVAT